MERYTKILSLVLAGLGSLLSNNAIAELQLCTNGGLQVSDPCNPCYWFRLNGRMDLDEILFSGSYHDRQNNFPSSANIRRAVLAFNGGVGDCLGYNLSLDFGRSQSLNNDNPATALATHGHTLIQEAWLGYTGLWDCSRLRIGQFTPISTMDFYANDGTCNGQMFLESALATMTFNVPSYIDTNSRMMKGLGIILDTQLFDTFTLAATVYQPAAGVSLTYRDGRRSDRLGEALRVTFSPIHDCDQVLHIGAMGRYQSLNHTDAGTTLVPDNQSIHNTLFFTPPEVLPRNYVGQSNFSGGNGLGSNDPTLIDAGEMRAKDYLHGAGEALAICGPLTFQGEFHHVTVHRKPEIVNIRNVETVRTGNVRFYGWHAQAGYVLTGESRSYDFANGTLGGINPCGAWGALEVVGRYSYVTLFDKDVFGGLGRNATVGLNWYVNNNVRLAFNYIRININPTNTARVGDNGLAGFPPRADQPIDYKRNLDVFAARLQITF